MIKVICHTVKLLSKSRSDGMRMSASILGCLLSMGLIIFLLVGQPACAQSGGTSGGRPRIDLDDPIYHYYPKKFDGQGTIDRITRHVIIIGDTDYKLASGVTFHTPNRRLAPARWFKKGHYVGFLLNAEGKVKSVWLLRLQ